MPQTSTPICPVPPEQQPLNEFTEIKEAWLFSWLTLPRALYIRKLLTVGLLGWVILGWPLAAASFPPSKAPVHFLISASGAAIATVTLLLVHLYIGWRHVRARLTNPTVEYEESGWYDGQVWTKTDTERAKDQLVATYQVEPVFVRLRWTFAALGSFGALGTALWVIV
ncbi:MAG: CGLD27 family protein [Cyanobacteria bacterium P01_C01_bin.89]